MHLIRFMYIIRRAALPVAVLAAGLASAGVAQARCGTSCQIRSLKRQVAKDTKALKVLASCLSEAPVSRYGSTDTGTGGYVYDPQDGTQPFITTALDATAPGDGVDIWVLYDGCNHNHAAHDASVRLGWFYGGQLAPSYALAARARR